MTGGGGGTEEPKAGNAQNPPSLLIQESMLVAEAQFLWPQGAPSFRTGLALSGGGIRAATVSLGVLQALADNGLLKQFHYLSTVSGGGYIGSALSWFWCKKRVDEENALSPSTTAPPLRFGVEAEDFPFQDAPEGQTPQDDPMAPRLRAAKNLEFLRNHGSYLTSGDGIGFAGLIIAVVRTILLSLMVWVPLVVLIFGIVEVLNFFLVGEKGYQGCIAIGPTPHDALQSYQCQPAYVAPLILAAALILLFLAGVVIFSFLSRFQLDSSNPGETHNSRYPRALLYLAVALASSLLTGWTYNSLDKIQVPMAIEILLMFLCSLSFFMLAIAEFFGPDNAGYFLRRSFEKQSSKLLPILVVSLYVGALPWIVSSLKPAAGVAFGSLGALGPLGGVITLCSGVGTALYGYYLKAKSILPGLAGQILAMAGSLLFLSGLLLFSFVLAAEIFAASLGFVPAPTKSSVGQEMTSAAEGISLAVQMASQAVAAASRQVAASDGVSVVSEDTASPTESTASRKKLVIVIFLSLVTLAVLIGLFGSVNATGLHRFYRDRLMETFLPMATAVEKGTAQQSNVADNLSIVDVVRDSIERENRPYHLVNAHAILVNDEVDPKVALRGGDNFLISPAFVGSSVTGWMRTNDYVRHHGALTLASAMAVSGAAANANAGYIGTGLTRDKFVSAVMSLLNIRLGLWVGNPRTSAKTAAAVDTDALTRKEPPLARFRTKVATYFNPVLACGIFGYGHHRNAPFLELSDGGHFENLGLYELIRRRLDLILVVDAEQDSDMSLSALVSSTNRIKEDFGVSVEFLDSRGPEQLLGKDGDHYPSGARLAKSPFVAVEIRYPDLPEIPRIRTAQPAKRAVLIYIKSTMVTGLAFATDGYKAANPDFPHQSTADQFFDPDQFEAYRDLGKKSCTAMIGALGLGDSMTNAEALLDRYGFPLREAACSPTSIADRDHKS